MQNRRTTERVRKIIELRAAGLTWKEIGAEIGITGEGCRLAWKRHVSGSSHLPPEVTGAGGPPTQELDVLDDSSDLNGSVSILKRDKILTPKELREAAGLGPEWLCAYYKPNTWEGFYKLKSGDDHRKVRLFQSKAVFKRIIGEELQEAILEWARDNVPPLPPRERTGPPLGSERYAVAWGLYDAHLGMYAFNKEVGTDYDVGIACNRCLNSIDDVAAELKKYQIKKIWMPVGNDFLHWDNVRMRTTSAQHDLDTDSRFARVYRAAIAVLCYMIETAYSIADEVDVFYVPGNHDYMTSYMLVGALYQRYRDWQGINVDLNENPQKIRRYGGTAVVWEHGADVKPNRWPLIFHEHVLNHARDHGIVEPLTYKEVQIGHTHQKRATQWEAETPAGGIRVVVNPSLCNTDFWHHAQGFIGGPMKSVEAWRYDEIGVRGSHVAWARDDERGFTSEDPKVE